MGEEDVSSKERDNVQSEENDSAHGEKTWGEIVGMRAVRMMGTIIDKKQNGSDEGNRGNSNRGDVK